MKGKLSDPLGCALLALLLALPSRVVAADAGTRITGPGMVRILQDIGYKAELARTARAIR